MGEIRQLLWDEQNIGHVGRHEVVPAEVEQVVFLGSGYPVDLNQPDRPGRVAIFGITSAGRFLAVYLDRPIHGFSYVLTARSMTPREQRTYLAVTGGHDD